MAVKIKGIPVELNGKEYIVPPLTLRSLELLMPKIKAIDKNEQGYNSEFIDALSDVVLAAFKRNYPEITREELLDLLDVSNMKTVFDAVMGISGLTKTFGDETNMGEAQAAV